MRASAPLLPELLQKVSRSFGLSIRLLPQALRAPVGVAYLLARISDTVADSAAAPVAQRLALLDQLAQGWQDQASAATQDTLARALDYVAQLRKTPIVVNDSRGFYTSRVFSTYVGEGLTLLAEGVKPALIENAGRMAGMPVGPLALADELSLELMARIRRQTAADLGAAYVRSAIDEVCDRTWEVVGGAVEEYDGGYSAFVLAKAERLRQASAMEARRNNLLRKELAWLRRGAPAIDEQALDQAIEMGPA